MIDYGYFDPARECRLSALPSRLSVDSDIPILFKLALRIEYVAVRLLWTAMGACHPVFVKQTQLDRRLCIIQLSAC
jgi:hypothetical protein